MVNSEVGTFIEGFLYGYDVTGKLGVIVDDDSNIYLVDAKDCSGLVVDDSCTIFESEHGTYGYCLLPF